MLRLLVLAACVALGFGADGHEWAYSGPNGPDHWSSAAPACGADMNRRQSPVDIVGEKMRYDYAIYGPQLQYGYHSQQQIQGTNVGHSVKFTFPTHPDVSVIVGAITYKLDSFHLHWGNEMGGSEHRLNGRAFSGELHMVHYRADFANVSAALHDSAGDALMVIGVFIQAENEQYPLHSDENQTVKKITESLRNMRYVGDKTSMMSITPADIVPVSSALLFHYEGGLTTPTCNGVVQWFVYKQPIILRYQTLATIFWDSNTVPLNAEKEPMAPNFRPIQALGARMIRTNDPDLGNFGTDDHTSSASSVAVAGVTGILTLTIAALL